MPDYIGDTNPFTDGKKAMLIVNEKTGKCAPPSEFDTLISDFVGSETEPGRLFVILEDKDVSGMHLDSFFFGEQIKHHNKNEHASQTQSKYMEAFYEKVL